MPAHLHINVKVPLPEGSLLDQGHALSGMKDAIDVLREALPAGHEYTDKIVKSSGVARKPRKPKLAA